MEIISGVDNLPGYPEAYVTIGTFDGFHLGHQKVIERLVEKVQNEKVKSVLITFAPHPREIVGNKTSEPIRFINSLEERIQNLASMNLDYLIIQPFNHYLANLEGEIFLEDYLLKNIQIKGFVMGENHTFGKDRKCTAFRLKELGEKKYNFDVEIISRVRDGDFIINSSNIRHLIATGKIELANKYMKKPYHLKGRVISGEKRGRTLQFPTLNILPLSPKKIIPKEGVYCVKVHIIGKSYKGMCNIGYRPTFERNHLTIEVHVIDQKLSNLYGREIDMEFFHYVREEMKFDSVEELKKQLEKDKIYCKNLNLEEKCQH
ncbi:MAG: bifunctional riboflavin kinase/FAD synthetase [Candidatus Marinimicrobia bacterium]|nr:bifunctional riboflavin kinase/FAD synthetase [Candidatus Neomarinimicrobiota bacterium]